MRQSYVRAVLWDIRETLGECYWGVGGILTVCWRYIRAEK